jgi:hypothetical protein
MEVLVMAKAKMTKCKSCGTEISAVTKVTCPKCGQVNYPSYYRSAAFIVLWVVLAIAIAIIASGSLNTDKSTKNDSVVTSENTISSAIVFRTQKNNEPHKFYGYYGFTEDGFTNIKLDGLTSMYSVVDVKVDEQGEFTFSDSGLFCQPDICQPHMSKEDGKAYLENRLKLYK